MSEQQKVLLAQMEAMQKLREEAKKITEKN